jgi:ribosomal protein S18 acetylase RimI-like enzyme
MKIVYNGKTKTGKEVIIRYPEITDLNEMFKYINVLSDEKTFIRYQGEHETLESEKAYLKSRLEEINNKRSVHLLVFFNNKLIAASDIHMMDKTEKHVGVFGISVAKEFRNEGIGRFLMEKVFEEAKKEIQDLEIVILEVYSKNTIAKRVYERFGFIEYGLLPNGISRNNTFEDAILMYKNIK